MPKSSNNNSEETLNQSKNELPSNNPIQPNTPNDDKDCAANRDPDNLSSAQNAEPTKSRRSRRARKPNRAKTPNSDKSPKPFENTLGNYLHFHSETSPSRPKSQNNVQAKPEPPHQDIEQQYINYVISLLEEDYENKFLSSDEIKRNKFLSNHQKPLETQKIAPFNSNLPILNISKCLSPKKMPRHEQHRQMKPNHVTCAVPKAMPRKAEFRKTKKHSAEFKSKQPYHSYGKLSKKKDRNQRVHERNADRHVQNESEFFPQNVSSFIALKSKFSQNLNWQTLRVAQELLPRPAESVRMAAFRQQLNASETSVLNVNIQNLLLASGM